MGTQHFLLGGALGHGGMATASLSLRKAPHIMSFELALLNALFAKVAVSAAVVILVTVAAERAGPLVGGLVATLPTTSGPAYVFLALDQSASFVADSALASLTVVPANVAYALIFASLARKSGFAISVGVGFLAWLVLALIALLMEWTLLYACLFNIVVFSICLSAGRRLGRAEMPSVRPRWLDLIARALVVALFVAVVVTASSRVGPVATGILVNAPILATSIMFTLHWRVGGPAAAAVLANFIPGLVGFSIAVITLHLTAISLGPVTALVLACTVSICCNFLLWLIQRESVACTPSLQH
jgi:uncharacterized membrane protein (GlpM family)